MMATKATLPLCRVDMFVSAVSLTGSWHIPDLNDPPTDMEGVVLQRRYPFRGRGSRSMAYERPKPREVGRDEHLLLAD